MIEPAAFHAVLARHGLTYFTGVPDSLLKDLCAYITDHVDPQHHVINANEGLAVALAAGYHLGTGRVPVVYLQNSGTGNAINPLLSLTHPSVYSIPMVLLIGWRGEPGAGDEPQHVTQGRVQRALMEAVELPHVVIDSESSELDRVVAGVVRSMDGQPRPHAILIRPGTFARYMPAASVTAFSELTRPTALETVLSNIDPAALVVASTGMISREIFNLRVHRRESHEHDFLTVGSMGHASQIALGIALARPERSVVCIDGDGALLMHMGSVAIIGTRRPVNFMHIVINNGAHDSVGGQPTAAGRISIRDVARACGYSATAVAANEAELAAELVRMRRVRGPSMLEVRVRSMPRTDAGRPTATPRHNKAVFMRALGIDA